MRLTHSGNLPMYCVNNKNILWLRLLFLFPLLAGCKTDLQNLPAFSEQKQLQVVILTPAGSSQPQIYHPEKNEFQPALVAGQPAKVNFLPFPGNFGFIPSTAYQPADSAVAGELLTALVLSASQPAGTVQEVIPIATAMLDVAGEKRPW
jgi:inorganic pyrophosphatase